MAAEVTRPPLVIVPPDPVVDALASQLYRRAHLCGIITAMAPPTDDTRRSFRALAGWLAESLGHDLASKLASNTARPPGGAQ